MTASDPPGTGEKHVLVILPTYNRADLLPVAVESVFLQDFPHKKLVIVDDGSTDGTREVCTRYVKDRPGIVTYVFKANGGCASARNVGLQSIDDETGYVCFLDSDDRLLPGKLSREVALLSRHPDAREDFRYNEDSDFLQKVALECRAMYSDEPGSWVRSHPGSKSRNLLEIDKAVFRSCRDILRAYPGFHREHAAVIDRRMEYLREPLFRDMIERGHYDEAKEYASTASETIIASLHLRASYDVYRKWRSFLRKLLDWRRRAYRKGKSFLRKLLDERR